jgi:hypothetical protein
VNALRGSELALRLAMLADMVTCEARRLWGRPVRVDVEKHRFLPVSTGRTRSEYRAAVYAGEKLVACTPWLLPHKGLGPTNAHVMRKLFRCLSNLRHTPEADHIVWGF